MTDKFRSNVQRTAQILREKLWRLTSPRSFAGRGRSRSAAKASGEGRGSEPNTRDGLSGRRSVLKTLDPIVFFIWRAQCLAPHPALRADLSSRKSVARLRGASRQFSDA